MSSTTLLSAGCSVFAGGDGEGALCKIRNTLVHEVRLASNVNSLVLAVMGANGGVPLGTVGIGLKFLNIEGVQNN